MAKKITDSEVSNQISDKLTVSTEIPVYVDALLKIFTEHEHLFVSLSGSVFTPDTPESMLGDAVLYKNPYYKQSNQ